MLSQTQRYLLNGAVATATHFFVLTTLVTVAELKSYGLANALASIFGIFVSFLGNRFYVFAVSETPLNKQLAKFLILYLATATLHGFVVFIWSDVYALHYQIGFLIATAWQVVLGYAGNKHLVFRG